MAAVGRGSSHRRTSPPRESRRSIKLRRRGRRSKTPGNGWQAVVRSSSHREGRWYGVLRIAGRASRGGRRRSSHGGGRRWEAHTLHTHTRHTHIHAGRQEGGRGACKPTHAHPPPTPDHPSFPDTPHQGRSACSPCSIGAHVFNRKNTNPLRCAAGRHAHIDSGS